MSYSPRVITPVGEDNFLLTVEGPNLARANARLDLDPPVEMLGPLAAEIASRMARSDFAFEERKLEVRDHSPHLRGGGLCLVQTLDMVQLRKGESPT